MDIYLDNSALSLLHCHRKFQLTVLKGLTTPANPIADFGSAFHKGMELLDKGLPPLEAVNSLLELLPPSVDKVKLLKLLTLFKTSTTVPPPITISNAPAIEFKFKFLYRTTNGISIYLTGTIDRIHIDSTKDLLIVADYKTSAGATDYMIAKTKKEYATAFQLPFYIFCLHQLAQLGMLPAAIKEYLDAGRYRSEIWFAFYNYPNEPFTKLPRPAFNKFYLDTIIPAVIDSALDKIMTIIAGDLDNIRAPLTGLTTYQACTHCNFRPACLVAGTDREVEILDNHYIVKPYDPMTFR